MSTVNILRTNAPMPTESELVVIRRFLFECLRGIDDDNQKAWKRIWSSFIKLGAGEISFVEFIFPRNPQFHRRFFALLQVGFDAWTPNRKRKSYKGRAMEKNFEQFREDITILAGHYEQTFDLRGRMVLKAKSISFSGMDDIQFERLYQDVITVLLREVCVHYKDRAELDFIVDRVLGFAS